MLERGRSLADQAGAGGPLAALPPPERARAQALAAATLRHLGRIDAVLGRFLDRRPPPAALNALRLAAAELCLDGVPAHAAVDGAVRLAGVGKRGRQLSGMVNAVARRVAEGARRALGRGAGGAGCRTGWPGRSKPPGGRRPRGDRGGAPARRRRWT